MFIYTFINYEQDSEEEFAEKYGEDLNCEEDSESEDSSETEDEGKKFVVEDNYFSEGEIEDPQETNYTFETFAIKPMKIYLEDHPLLLKFHGIPWGPVVCYDPSPTPPKAPKKKNEEDVPEIRL